jgi:hypothetical protein
VKARNEFALNQINIGDAGPDFIVALTRMNPELKSVSFRVYSPIPDVQARLATAGDRPAEEMVNHFLHHENRSMPRWEVLTQHLTSQLIRQKIEELAPEQALAFDSRCVVHDGSARYFPMVDFKVSSSPENLQFVQAFVKAVASGGVIVDSGASYHFYGFGIIDRERWVTFMGKCLLAPWPDARWIGHSLIENDGGDLRISHTKLKPTVPSVVQIVMP